MRLFVTEQPRTHIKERRRKRRHWVLLWTIKIVSKGAYYSITNDLRLTDEENFRIGKKPLAANQILWFCLNKNLNYVFTLFFIVHKWTMFIKISWQLMLLYVFTSCNSENKITYSAQVRLHWVLLKKIISV